MLFNIAKDKESQILLHSYQMEKVLSHTISHNKSSQQCQKQYSITCCKISPQAKSLAVGDSHGNISIYNINQEKQLLFETYNNAHKIQHDWIKKKDVQPSIGCIEWMNKYDNHDKLFTTNGAAVKLWKLKYLSFEQSQKNSSYLQNLPSHSHQWLQMAQLPKLHIHMIDTLSLSSNQQFLLSSDGCSIMKWSLQKLNKPFIMNIPEVVSPLIYSSSQNQTQDQTRAINQQKQLWQSIKLMTTAKFCHTSDNRIAYATKYGQINYIDMRLSTSIKPSIKLNNKIYKQNIQYYISQMSDIDFPSQQNKIVSRDYLYSYIWDLRKPTQPAYKSAVFPTINSQICDMYSQSRVFDRFQVKVNSCCSTIITNHYEQSFHSISISQNRNIRYMHQNGIAKKSELKIVDRDYPELKSTQILNYIDYNQSSDLLAACRKNSILLYQQKGKSYQSQTQQHQS